MATNGKNVYVKVAGAVVALALDCELSESMSLKEVSSLSGGTSKCYAADKDEWKVTCSHLLALSNYARLRSYLKGRTAVALEFAVDFGDHSYKLTGNAFMTRLSTTGPVNRMARLSAEFTGTGDLSATVV